MAAGSGVQFPSACLGWGLPEALLETTPGAVDTACHVDGRCFQTAVTVAGGTYVRNRQL